MLNQDELRELYLRGIKQRTNPMRFTAGDLSRGILATGHRPEEVADSAVALLRANPGRLKADCVEALVGLIQLKRPDDYPAILATLLLCANHQRNEDIAQSLQREKDPATVDALYQAALTIHDHLDYDEFFNLARKCTWALADIGTPEARGRLEQLSKCGNPTIAGYAQKRLDSWEDELPRKGRSGGT